MITEKNWLELKDTFSNENKIPFDIIKTFPVIKFRDKKIIPFLTSNETFKKQYIDFYFSPRIPLTKKNFF